MFQTIGHTFSLIKTSWRVLMKDRELILFPVMSGIALLVVLGVFGAIGAATGALTRLNSGAAGGPDAVLGVVMFIAAYFVVIFFNAALISAAMERLRGGDPNVGYGLSHASGHILSLFGWAIIAAVVAIIFSLIRGRNRNNIFAQIFADLLETGWHMITFFVVPIIVNEGTGPIASMKRSTQLFTATWGRQLTANFGFGILYFLALLAAGAIAFLFFAIFPLLGLVVGVVLFALAIGTVQALEGIFKAALYDYARGERPLEFAEEDLRSAYRPQPA